MKGQVNKIKYLSYHCSQFYPDINAMLNKYISTRSNELLTYMHGKNRNCFDYSLAHKALPITKRHDKERVIDAIERRCLLHHTL
jgi:hypothetical protein